MSEWIGFEPPPRVLVAAAGVDLRKHHLALLLGGGRDCRCERHNEPLSADARPSADVSRPGTSLTGDCGYRRDWAAAEMAAIGG